VVLAQVVVANVIMLEVAANVLAPGDHSKTQMTQDV